MIEQAKAAIARTKLNRFHVLLMFICMFVVLTEGYDLVIYGSIKGQIIAEWGITPVTAGFLGSAALVGMMIGSFSLGLLADLWGRKRVLLACLVVFCTGTGLAGFTNGAVAFALCRFIAGLGIGGAMPNAIGLLSDYIPEKSKNTLIATAMAGMQIGGILAPVLSLLLDEGSWRICLWVGFLPLVAVPLMIKFLPDSLDYLARKGQMEKIEKMTARSVPGFRFQDTQQAAATAAAAPEAKETGLVGELFTQGRARNTLLFWCAFFMGLLMIYGLNTWLPELMISGGYAIGSSLTFLIALNSAALVGSFVLGRVADRVNTKRLLVLLYLVGVVSMLLLSLKTNIVVAYILVSLCGISVFGCQNIGTAFVSSNYPGRVRSTGLGLCNTVGRLGGVLGPTLGGVLVAAAWPMFLNCLAFAVPGAVAALAYGLCRENPQQ